MTADQRYLGAETKADEMFCIIMFLGYRDCPELMLLEDPLLG